MHSGLKGHLCIHELKLCLTPKSCLQATKRPAPAEGEVQPIKKAKAASDGTAAAGSGSTPSEAPKKRGRPSNKEVGMLFMFASKLLALVKLRRVS